VRKSLALLGLVWIARRRGTRIVWTVHNLESHDRRFPRVERWFWRGFVRQVDGVISLSHAGQQAALRRYPALRRAEHFVIPHGHYRSAYPNDVTRPEARARLGIAPAARVAAFVGQLRAYKNVPELIAAARASADADLVALVCGKPASDALRDDLRVRAGDDPRVQLRLEPIAKADMQLILNAADLVVLPYRDVLNSGAALLALSFDRPVLVPNAGALSELRQLVGADWVRTYDGALSAPELEDALTWSRVPRAAARAPLGALEWSSLARETAAAYERVVAHRRDRRAMAAERLSAGVAP
jgi:glycosyltransferase involved in cell wall biosynthesis